MSDFNENSFEKSKKIFNITILNGTIDKNSWNNVPRGEVNITFYISDLADNIGMSSVNVAKDIPSVPGYNVFLVIGVISSVVFCHENSLYQKKI